MKMKSNGGMLFKRALLIALAMFLTLPTLGFAAQNRDGYWGRRGNNDDQRRERRQDRRERRDERRSDRREDRRERRDDRSGRDWGRDRDNNNYGGSFQLRQTALNAGYNNGIEEGRKDRDRNDRYDYNDEGDYQKATEDYNSRLGDKELYRRYFREGFQNGYRDGYGNRY